MEGLRHVAVMPEEVVAYLSPKRGGIYVDCTLGAGGHSRRIAEAMGAGRLIGFDKDPQAIELGGSAMAGSGVEFEAVHADFAEVAERLRERGVEQVDGVIADLGMSSMQIGDAERGFSFAADGPLDMRMDPRQEVTAEQVVNQFSERELADLIFQYGEERRSRRISRAIVRSRPLHSTAQLAALVAAVTRPMNAKRTSGPHPATRTFQALRIFVNSEMASLDRWLSQLPGLLKAGGRAVVISFHSLEDRPVKQSFRAGAQAGLYKILTPHTVRPSAEEATRNPRARSAKLRAVGRTEAGHGRAFSPAN
ncbi:MAG TPA: 16S rRNA (cytosine(1402)-N(4))-methyltransferase RsmH [Terriglobales bacterium]|nr:16S rRNA (cytosine(1402)-N(4))-methyltransferase RsmH [Terriglobales bacterium]